MHVTLVYTHRAYFIRQRNSFFDQKRSREVQGGQNTCTILPVRCARRAFAPTPATVYGQEKRCGEQGLRRGWVGEAV